MSAKVVVTGIGLVTPLGIGKDPSWAHAVEGRSGARRITAFDPSAYRCQIAAEVSGWDPAPYLGQDADKKYERSTQFALVASEEAIHDAHLDLDREDPDRIGVCMGSGLGGIFFAETQLTSLYRSGPRGVHPLTVPRVMPNAVASDISIRWKFSGPNITLSTACASGAHAIGQALIMLRDGRAAVMITGGVETPIFPLIFAGFDSLRVMAKRNDEPEQASRPFDRDRDGFVMGEGSGILILETEDHAKRRGAPMYAELAGYGASGGGHHMVAPDPTGRDAVLAIKSALGDAEMSPDKVDYINAHGTSTELNDLVETRAIKEVFGPRAAHIPVSSTKSVTGHMIGAAGAVEAAFSVLALRDGVIPPTMNYENPDARCDLDYVPGVARKKPVRAVLSNSFGFGNNNACLAFRSQNGKG